MRAASATSTRAPPTARLQRLAPNSATKQATKRTAKAPVARSKSRRVAATPKPAPTRVKATPVTPQALPTAARKTTTVSGTAPSVVAVAKSERPPRHAAVSLGANETGDGTPQSPFVQHLAAKPNRSGCVHCPSAACPCAALSKEMGGVFEQLRLKRITSFGDGRRDLCAKSILPVFVSRLVRQLRITSADTFWDLGCGNGSVVFQVAFMTGAACVGVELNEHNAEVARQAWAVLRPRLERLAGRPMPSVTILTGDLARVLSDPAVFDGSTNPNTVVWTANLLMPRSLTQFMAESFRTMAKGARVACFDDLYPHKRSVARVLDREIFELFEMYDARWSPESVEWALTAAGSEVGPFFFYDKVQ